LLVSSFGFTLICLLTMQNNHFWVESIEQGGTVASFVLKCSGALMRGLCQELERKDSLKIFVSSLSVSCFFYFCLFASQFVSVLAQYGQHFLLYIHLLRFRTSNHKQSCKSSRRCTSSCHSELEFGYQCYLNLFMANF
jgi:hypothetical protein